MEWIGCVCCEKFRHDFVARTFALIAPVQHVFHQVSCSNETIPNAPKHYETHQKMSVGSNVVDQVRLLGKTLTRLPGTNFCIICTSSACFARSSWSNGMNRMHSLRIILPRLLGTNYCIICTSSARFAPSFMQY